MFRWIVRTFTGHLACRVYVALIVLLLCLTTVARLRSYLMTRKIYAVLNGLAKLQVDQSSEEQLRKSVPQAAQIGQWTSGGSAGRRYFLEISNESDRLVPRLLNLVPDSVGQHLSDWLGYRYIGFDATVFVEDGKVSKIFYGLARRWGRPRALSYFVSAESVHGFWRHYHRGFTITAEEDESPQYRPHGDEKGLGVTYTNDASPESTKRAFRLDLSCFWSLGGCEDAREVAPEVWEDLQVIQAKTNHRKQECPDSIIDGRMRYLPDISVELLEVAGSRRVEVNEEGYKTSEQLTDLKFIKLLRGDQPSAWGVVRFRDSVPSPTNPMVWIQNPVGTPTKIGSQVLFFGNFGFSSCRFIPATPSALEIILNTPVPPKRPEDEIMTGLL